MAKHALRIGELVSFMVSVPVILLLYFMCEMFDMFHNNNNNNVILY